MGISYGDINPYHPKVVKQHKITVVVNYEGEALEQEELEQVHRDMADACAKWMPEGFTSGMAHDRNVHLTETIK
jgi:hypothetical protein